MFNKRRFYAKLVEWFQYFDGFCYEHAKKDIVAHYYDTWVNYVNSLWGKREFLLIAVYPPTQVPTYTTQTESSFKSMSHKNYVQFDKACLESFLSFNLNSPY